MKKMVSLLLVFCVLFSTSACSSNIIMGTYQETSVKKYGKWDKNLDVPSFLPSNVEKYTVNSYSYTLYSYLDECYEIFLDITVDEIEFNRLLTEARAHSNNYTEQLSDYCDGYHEIVFMNDYEQDEISEHEKLERIGWADIEKIIYNADTNTIIYVVFHANDRGVYEIKNVAYFNRFSIAADEYK